LNFANNGLIAATPDATRPPTFVSLKEKQMNNKTKIALVTGGSRGLGKDMALQLAKKGIDVILTYRNSKDEAQHVVADIARSGRTAAALPLDTGNIKSFAAFFDQLKSTLDTIFHTDRFDFLINNAGIGRYGAIGQVTEEIFDELMNVHFKGVYFLTQQALTLLNDGGGIVNISTGLARFTIPNYSAYASMKGAIEVFTRYLAKELGPRGIKANTVAPGAIATDFGGGRVRDDQEVNKWVSSMTALGRAGLAEDIGGVVAFLCTEDARWITAQRIEVSGGTNL
jgi:NAD(P)-dependent dehydrogenase (short-subunit alcohol dehydrogenase family)